MVILVNKRLFLIVLILLFSLGFARNIAFAISETKLTASDAATGDLFGRSVSISGNIVVVGAATDDDAGSSSGSAYVFRYNGTSWAEETKLTASDAAAGDYFGQSVSISGETIVVGAYGDDDAGGNSGSAYVFRHNGTSWAEESKLTASDGIAEKYFGQSASISGDNIVVGAVANYVPAPNPGSAYVFRYSGGRWVEKAKLRPSVGSGNEVFGWSVSINGDTVVVGAIYIEAAYVFGITDILISNKPMPWIPLLLLGD